MNMDQKVTTMDIDKEYQMYEERKHKRIFFAAGGAVCILWFVFASIIFFLPPSAFPADTVFEIEQGKGLGAAARDLEDHHIIRFSYFFIFLSTLFGKEGDIKAGLYYFERPLSLIDIFFRLTNGNYAVSPFRATIKEGATIYGIGLFFKDKGFFKAEDFWKAAGLNPFHYGSEGIPYVPLQADYTEKTALLSLQPNGAGLEGFLFPDTYFFPPSITPAGVIHAMLENFDRKITEELRSAISATGRSFYDTLIMASIIQREASDEKDARIISGILWKRIENDYPLQVDAVLSYITGRGSYELTVNDLEIDSPFNVYNRIGLPPAPISNPGIEAIQAAIYPQATEYWYYLHDAKGNAYYAKTFEEHKANKEKYLRL